VNRTQWKNLAEDRILDAQLLVNSGRASAAYYLAGYSVECALKACIMAHVEATGVIFQTKNFSEQCWTHDLKALLILADLEPEFNRDAKSNPDLFSNWVIVQKWTESSRYETKSTTDAQKILDAISNDPNGVLPWFRTRW
jgi:HEPN domain-containing protein